MKFLLEHRLPKKLGYSKDYFQTGRTSLAFSLDGTSADWHATTWRRRAVRPEGTRRARPRSERPAVEMLDGGEWVVTRNAAGYEEQWEKPRWVLGRACGRRD
jgi:hypothetical protein